MTKRRRRRRPRPARARSLGTRCRPANGRAASAPIRHTPKIVGADVELASFLPGVDRPGGTGGEASRALLREFVGVPAAGGAWPGFLDAWSVAGRASLSAGEEGRQFLPSNGGSVYIDLDHLEICCPEVRSAFDHVAAWHAMLRLTRGALHAANARRPDGSRIEVLVNTSDGLGHSYGAHLNFLVTRRAWDHLFTRRLQYLLSLGAFQVSAIVLTGQGKVGSENGRPPAPFQISQRADFVESLVGPQTTFNRPLVNSRDEPLCGGRPGDLAHRAGSAPGGSADERLARLHVIFFDATMCQVACVLKVGLMQMLLAMIEAERMPARVLLEDPLDALATWSRDPDLRTTTRLATGGRTTAVELQRRFLEQVARFVEGGGCDGLVPDAKRLIALWDDTLTKLETRDFDSLAARLDWVLKRSMIERARARRPRLRWDAPELKQLDHLYAGLETKTGLYWAWERQGAVEQVVTDDAIEAFTTSPPEDTRAWTRAMLLRRLADGDRVEAVDWDVIRARCRGALGRRRTLDMQHPMKHGRAQTKPSFDATNSTRELLDRLGARDEATTGQWFLRPGMQRGADMLLADRRKADPGDTTEGTDGAARADQGAGEPGGRGSSG